MGVRQMHPASITTQAAANHLGLAASTLEKLRVNGGGPRYIKMGRAVRYRRGDLERWLDERAVSNTSEKLFQ